MSRKSIFTVVGGAALGLLIAAGILWVEPLAAEAEYVEEQEPVSPLVAEVIRQETPQKAAYTHESTMTVTAYCPLRKMLWSVFKRLYSHRSESNTGRDHRYRPRCDTVGDRG